MLKYVIYILFLTIISSLYSFLISFILTDYYIHNTVLVYLLLLQLDDFKSLNKIMKKENNNDDIDRYMNIICNQSYEIQKYKLIIEKMKKNNMLKRKCKSYEDFSNIKYE